MSFQEKRSFVSLFANVAVFTVYYLYLCGLEQPAEPLLQVRFWCAAILISLPVLIVCKIVIHILFSIVNTIATRENEPGFEDELDKLIDLKAVRNFSYVFSAGVLLSLAAPLLNLPLQIFFEILLFTILAAGITLDLSQLYFYRKGV
jgi:hypothetical protein